MDQILTNAAGHLFQRESDNIYCQVMIFHCRGSRASVAALEEAGANVHQVAETAGRPDLETVLKVLAEVQINDVWVEAGPTLNGALLQSGLMDELIVYQAASVLGADARGMFEIQSFDDMKQRPEFELTDIRKVGADLRLCYKPGN